MFRPTQTAPIALTAFNTLLGTILTVALLVLALINSIDPRVFAEIGVDATEHSGLLFLASVFIFIAALRPLAGGVILAIYGGLIVTTLPIIGSVAIGFALLSFLRAWMSRRYLASKDRSAEVVRS
jgi:hypothetical protein